MTRPELLIFVALATGALIISLAATLVYIPLGLATFGLAVILLALAVAPGVGTDDTKGDS